MRSRTCSSSAPVNPGHARDAAPVTKRNHWGLALGAACLILVSVTAGGCVLGNDNDRPVLAIDPLWDLTPGDRFSGQTCQGADVVYMTWEIQDSRGKKIKASKDGELEDCKPLDFIGLVPGTYRLQIAGYDRYEDKLWETTCPAMELGRFDVLYFCEVDQLAGKDDRDAGEPPDDEPDAG
jgi:hypothetical protein